MGSEISLLMNTEWLSEISFWGDNHEVIYIYIWNYMYIILCIKLYMILYKEIEILFLNVYYSNFNYNINIYIYNIYIYMFIVCGSLCVYLLYVIDSINFIRFVAITEVWDLMRQCGLIYTDKCFMSLEQVRSSNYI